QVRFLIEAPRKAAVAQITQNWVNSRQLTERLGESLKGLVCATQIRRVVYQFNIRAQRYRVFSLDLEFRFAPVLIIG
ncbi:MAG: hypothetical protein M3R67_10270, partial [Acidobacteriota bacterium]|nr:hypothetical protein [Acidobacteriota bacterium]